MKYRLPEINWDLTLNDIPILHMKTLDNLKIQMQMARTFSHVKLVDLKRNIKQKNRSVNILLFPKITKKFSKVRIQEKTSQDTGKVKSQSHLKMLSVNRLLMT